MGYGKKLKSILIALGYDEMPNVDRLLAEYCKLTDEGREQVFDIISSIAKHQTDPERVKILKEIS